METKSIQLKTLFAAISLILLIEAIASIFAATGTSSLPLIGAIRLLEISGLLALVFLLEGNLSCIGLYSSGTFFALGKGALWSIGFGLIAALAALLLWVSGTNPFQLVRVRLPSDSASRVLFFSVGGVIGPVAEEIFFRGLIFRFFRPWGFIFALCFSTVIFAALHSASAGIPVAQLVGGLLFATAFEFEKNLLVPTIIHILGNLAIFSFSFITN